MNNILRHIERFIPKRLYKLGQPVYHFTLSSIAALKHGIPSRKILVIGVTGTKGKTSVINFIWSVLMAGGFKTGIITTANIRIGETELLNSYHMTMPGRSAIQGLLQKMVKEGCKVCLVETTSEGLKQFRHIGIVYDIAVFTNLTPEHLSSHGGSFEKYKQAKGKLFATLKRHRKTIDGKKIQSAIIANTDSEHASYYLGFKADKKITFGIASPAEYQADSIRETHDGVTFSVAGKPFVLSILGGFNVYNALPAIAIGRLLGISDDCIKKGLNNLRLIPGRMEVIKEGQPFTLIVDYAHEKQSITGVLKTANAMKKPDAKTIILLGAEGGGRDKAKRPIMGELAGKMADYLVVSNVDPYEDDPTEIVEDIAVVAEKFGKVRNKDLFVIEDRRAGISKALSLAKAGDIVLITGKGAEQSMIIGGKSIPWDDRVIVKEELNKII